MAFVCAEKLERIPPGSIHEVRVGDRTIAVANVEGMVYAVDNACLHRAGPLGQGELEGNVVTCPLHGWQYDVTTGQVTFNPSMQLVTYPAEIRGDEIWVDLG